MTPQFPLYVVSYGRPDSCLTTDALDDLDVAYRVVIESQEYDDYAAHFDESKLLVVPERYHEEYKACDDHGREKPLGPGPARNFAWEHAADNDYNWYWVMDDNIRHFARYTDNTKQRLSDGSGFCLIEDFVTQYSNIAMAGPRYRGFVHEREKQPPIVLNTRIYSCNLIRTDIEYEWKCRYNEDTDLSLRLLKDGWVTVLFTTVLQDKVRTQTLDGGNTDNFYAEEGTYLKSRMLKRRHPDVVTLVKKDPYHKPTRWHHKVNYQPFKGNKLQRKTSVNSDEEATAD